MACLFTTVEAKFTDAPWAILQKILCKASDAAASGGSSGPNLRGSGDPGGVVSSTAVGQFYVNQDTNTVWQSTATGTGSWVQVI